MTIALFGLVTDITTQSTSFIFVRELSDIEVTTAQEASRLLSRLTSMSPFYQYKLAKQKLDDLVTAIAGAQSQAEARGLLSELPGLYKSALMECKSFLDQSAKDLSTKFGKDSAEFQAFVAATNTEYDANLEYRLAHNLRNESIHISQVLSISFGRTISGQKLTVRIQDAVLDRGATPEANWSTGFRAEVPHIPRPVEALPILDVVDDCCYRLWSVWIRQYTSEVTEARSIFLGYQDEVSTAVSGAAAMIFDVKPDLQAPATRRATWQTMWPAPSAMEMSEIVLEMF
jgi:hypothetical protein